MRSPPGRQRVPAAPYGMTFGVGQLRQVRRVTAAWAARAGLTGARAGSFVMAVSDIAASAVRHGRPPGRLLLSVDGPFAVAEVRGSSHLPGVERPDPEPPGPAGRPGPPQPRRAGKRAGIRVTREGTNVRLRMRLDRPGRPAR